MIMKVEQSGAKAHDRPPWRQLRGEGKKMTGKFEHTIDAKGRLFIPSKLREELGSNFQLSISASRDENGVANTCLVLYPKAVWQELEEKINALPSGQAAKADVMLAYSAPCEPDSHSRIVIPQNLREFAKLQRDVVITGSSNKAKIWDRETWERMSAPQLDPGKVADMFDLLGL
jgi:MraZ protein